jgi:hypothetical protein
VSSCKPSLLNRLTHPPVGSLVQPSSSDAFAIVRSPQSREIVSVDLLGTGVAPIPSTVKPSKVGPSGNTDDEWAPWGTGPCGKRKSLCELGRPKEFKGERGVKPNYGRRVGASGWARRGGAKRRRRRAGVIPGDRKNRLRASGQNSLPPCGGGLGWGVEMLAAKELPPPTPALPHKGGGRKFR